MKLTLRILLGESLGFLAGQKLGRVTNTRRPALETPNHPIFLLIHDFPRVYCVETTRYY
jgi:hypothetical protein